jgi:hypothetical protein
LENQVLPGLKLNTCYKMKAKFKIVLIMSALITALFSFSCISFSSHKKNQILQISGTDTAIIAFNEYEHDLGKITAGEKVASIFTFENKGKGPLVVLSVETSCGCTVPKYDTKPIDPGSSGTL